MNLRDRLSPAQIQALESVSQAFADDRCVLVGATAIHCRIELPRTTADVDFAVASDAASVVNRLERAGWVRTTNNRHRWTLGSSRIDVIPVTNEDIRTGQVDLGDGLVMSVVGFDLAYAQANALSLAPNTQILVPHLPVLVFLKMVSWLDRPNLRTKDLGDLMFMVDSMLPVDDLRRWEAPLSTMQIDFEDQSAFFAGSELAEIVAAPHAHWVRVFLDRMRDENDSEFATLLSVSRIMGADRERKLRSRLDAFENGFEGSLRNHAEETEPFAPLSTEVPRTAGLMLHDAIDRRRIVQFRYAGLSRVAEPHVLGIKNGQLHVLAWQNGGQSRSRPFPGWRRFRVARISELGITDQTFPGRRLTRGTPSSFDRHIALVR